MIQPTPKAQTLPDDLKSHWAEAMAEKFPMTPEEAAAYIGQRYNRPVRIIPGGVQVDIREEKRVFQGQIPPSGYWYERDDYNTMSKIYVSYEQITITDLKPSVIAEKMERS